MWWRWTVLIICTLLVLACVVSTTLDWIKGKTGPFGPNPADWWGCGAFTLVLVIVMYLVGRQLF